MQPPLQIRQVKDCIFVDVRRFGEYSLQLRKIVIQSNDSEDFIWSARARTDQGAQIGTIELCVGRNASKPPIRGEGDNLDVSVPNGGDSFELEREKKYLVTVSASGYLLSAREVFAIK